MALLDIAHKVITLKIVYCGCAVGGKTTNLISLARLTDPEGGDHVVSIATKDDRTLFFDLLPVDLGTVGGFTVKAKVFTVPGQPHYEVTRRQVLAGADGVAFIVDSKPADEKANAWAMQNLRFNLKQNSIDADQIPMVIQWNKRDLPGAAPVAALAAALNPRRCPAFEAVATEGRGVVETFSALLQATIAKTYAKVAKATVPSDTIRKVVEAALAPARAREPAPHAAPAPAFDHRFDMAAYRETWAEQGRDRQIIDQETLLAESVKTSLELAERLSERNEVDTANRIAETRMGALLKMIPSLADPAIPRWPAKTMASLLAGAQRAHGSAMLFRSDSKVMDEAEVVPAGHDALNAAVAASLGSAAYRLCLGSGVRFVEDLEREVFFGTPPAGSAELSSCLVVPLRCDDLAIGGLVVYQAQGEPAFGEAEKEFWSACGILLSLSLRWRGLRASAPAGAVSASRA